MPILDLRAKIEYLAFLEAHILSFKAILFSTLFQNRTRVKMSRNATENRLRLYLSYPKFLTNYLQLWPTCKNFYVFSQDFYVLLKVGFIFIV